MASDGNAEDARLQSLRSAFEEIGLPVPPDLTSDRIKSLLRRGLLEPEGLEWDEIRELSASVIHFMVSKPRG